MISRGSERGTEFVVVFTRGPDTAWGGLPSHPTAFANGGPSQPRPPDFLSESRPA
jgi:hypothetical protein